MSSISKRVVIRAPSDLFDEHNDIVNLWFREQGFHEHDETYHWTNGGHYMRVGAEGGGRFHMIIDMYKDGVQNPNLRTIPYEIWRASKDPKQDPPFTFKFLEPETHEPFYRFVRDLGLRYTWGESKRPAAPPSEHRVIEIPSAPSVAAT